MQCHVSVQAAGAHLRDITDKRDSSAQRMPASVTFHANTSADASAAARCIRAAAATGQIDG